MEIQKLDLDKIFQQWVRIHLLNNDRIGAKVIGILEQELVLQGADGIKKWVSLSDILDLDIVSEAEAMASPTGIHERLLDKLMHPQQVEESLSSLFNAWVKESTIEEMVQFSRQEQVRVLYREDYHNTYFTARESEYYQNLTAKGGKVFLADDEALKNALIKFILRNPLGFKGWNLYSKLMNNAHTTDRALHYCLTLIPCILNTNGQYDRQNIINIGNMLKESPELNAYYGVYTIYNWLYMYSRRGSIGSDLPLVGALRAFTKGKPYVEADCGIYYFTQFTGSEQAEFRSKVVRDYIRLLSRVNDQIQIDYNYLYNKCAQFLATEWGEEEYYFECFRDAILHEDMLLGVQMCREILYRAARKPMREERLEQRLAFVQRVFEEISQWRVDEQSRALMAVCNQLIEQVRKCPGSPVLLATLPLLSPYPNPLSKAEMDKYMGALDSAQSLEVFRYLVQCYGYGNGVMGIRMEDAYRRCLTGYLESDEENTGYLQQLLEGMCDLQLGRLGSQSTGSVVMNQNSQKAVLCMMLTGREHSLEDVVRAYAAEYEKTDRYQRFKAFEKAVREMWQADREFAGQLFLMVLSDCESSLLRQSLEWGNFLQPATADFFINERIGGRKILFRLYLKQVHSEEMEQIITNLGGDEQNVLEQLRALTLSDEERRLLVALLGKSFPNLKEVTALATDKDKVSVFMPLLDVVFGTKQVMSMLNKYAPDKHGYEMWRQAAISFYGAENFESGMEAEEAENTKVLVYQNKALETGRFYEFSFIGEELCRETIVGAEERRELEEQLRNYTRWGFAHAQQECLETLIPICHHTIKDAVYYNDYCVRLGLLMCDGELKVNPFRSRSIFWEVLTSMKTRGYRYTRANMEVLKGLLIRVLEGYHIQELDSVQNYEQLLVGLEALRDNGLTQMVVTDFIDKVQSFLKEWSGSEAKTVQEMVERCRRCMEILQKSPGYETYGKTVAQRWYGQLKKETERLENGAVLVASAQESILEDNKVEIIVRLKNIGKQAASGLGVSIAPGIGWKDATGEMRLNALHTGVTYSAIYTLSCDNAGEQPSLDYAIRWTYMDGELRSENATRESLLTEAELQRMNAELAYNLRQQLADTLQTQSESLKAQEEKLGHIEETLEKVNTTTQGIDETTKRTEETAQGIDKTTQDIKKDTEEILKTLHEELTALKEQLPREYNREDAERYEERIEEMGARQDAGRYHDAMLNEWTIPEDVLQQPGLVRVLEVAFWLKAEYVSAGQSAASAAGTAGQQNQSIDCSPVVAMLGKFLEGYLNGCWLDVFKQVDVQKVNAAKGMEDRRGNKISLYIGGYTYLTDRRNAFCTKITGDPYRVDSRQMARLNDDIVICRDVRNDADHYDPNDVVTVAEMERCTDILFKKDPRNNRTLLEDIKKVAERLEGSHNRR